jgi:hypothetical protein
MRSVSAPKVVTTLEATESALPAEIQEALGEFIGAAREGLPRSAAALRSALCTRNVKCWEDGDMRKRWTAVGMLVAEQQFRRIIGYRDLAKLVIPSNDTPSSPPPRGNPPARRPPSPLPSDRQPRRSPSKFHDDPDPPRSVWLRSGSL